MLRRILVAIDADAEMPFVAQEAIRLAKRSGATLTGLAIVASNEIDADTAGGGIGSMYFAEKRRRELKDAVRSSAQESLAAFAAAAEAAGVRHADDHVEERGVVQSLVEAALTYDLLVTGFESHFYFADPERRTHAVARVVREGATPVLVLGSAALDVRRVLVAYDGSAASARTLKAFCWLSPFGTDVALDVVHVWGGSEADRVASDELLRRAQAFAEAHGYTAQTTSIEGGNHAERLLEFAERAGADVIVSGAYASGAIRQALFGTTAKTLIQLSPVPLFLSH